MATKEEIEKLPRLIETYLRRVIRVPYKLVDGGQPRVVYPRTGALTKENTTVYLPLTPKSLCAFLGEEAVRGLKLPALFGLMAGLSYHEVAHALSGERAHTAPPPALANLIHDSNDFSVVPALWPGSIPFTNLLMRVTNLQLPDLAGMDCETGPGRAALLFNAALSFLRKRKVRFGGRFFREPPPDHLLRGPLERIRRIVLEARLAPVEERPRLIRDLHAVFKDCWKDSPDGLEPLLAGSLEVRISLDAAGAEGLNEEAGGPGLAPIREALSAAREEVEQEEGRKRREQARNQGTRRRREALERLSAADERVDLDLKTSAALGPPVAVPGALVRELRNSLRPLLFERSLARRSVSTEGLRFAPERFHKVRVNPRRPKVFKEVRRVKRNPAETDVLLCFDRSGSMEGKKETLAKGIAGAVVLALAAVPQARVRLLAFESSVELVLTGAPLPPERVLALVAGGLRARGGTNLPLAFRQAIRLLEDSTSPRRLALLLTDGDTSGVYSLPDLMELAGARGVDFLCIGIPEADPGKLQQTFGEKALYVADLSSLPEEIARVLPKVV